MKVLHLPTSTGGNSWGLAQGERKLGLNSTVLYTQSNYLSYPSNINLHIENDRHNYTRLLKLTKAFVHIRNRYDIFHFNFGQSLLSFPNYNLFHAELPFYPKSSKLFVTYNGCDARQKYPTIMRREISPCHDDECYDGRCNSGKIDIKRRKLIKKMSKYVKHIWALNPDLLYFLPPEKSSFLPYSISPFHRRIHCPDFHKRKLTIVHAPTNRTVKGSKYVMDSIDSLKKTHGKFFDFITIENFPHDEATKLYQKADLVIDQLLAGWYGALAIEVMSIGKPVICRIEKNDLHFIPPKMAKDIPEAFIDADPYSLYNVLVQCLEDRQFLKYKSDAGIEFASTWHDPKSVARITKASYDSL